MPNRQWVTLFVQRKTIWAQKRKAQRVGQCGEGAGCACARKREQPLLDLQEEEREKRAGRRGRGEEGGRDKEEGLGRGGLGVYRT